MKKSSTEASPLHQQQQCQFTRSNYPKLTIRPFDGTLTPWTTFWESYKSAIHENPILTDIDKFNYLRSLLERSALDVVASPTMTAANYEEAVQVLQKRYGNK